MTERSAVTGERETCTEQRQAVEDAATAVGCTTWQRMVALSILEHENRVAAERFIEMDGLIYCESCKRERTYGHMPDCELAAALNWIERLGEVSDGAATTD